MLIFNNNNRVQVWYSHYVCPFIEYETCKMICDIKYFFIDLNRQASIFHKLFW